MWLGWVQRIVLVGSAVMLFASMLTSAHATPAERAQVGVSFSASGQAQTLSATGVADLTDVPSPEPPPALTVSMVERSAGLDSGPAVRQVLEKAAAVRVALERVGVAPSSIQVSSARVSPVYSNPTPGSAQPAQSVQGYNVSEDLRVVGLSPDKIDRAAEAAFAAGATYVNRTPIGFRPSPAPPDNVVLSAAVKRAAEEARAMAQAGAQAVGVTLGSLRNVNVQLPTFPIAGPTVGPLRVSVTVTYELRQP